MNACKHAPADARMRARALSLSRSLTHTNTAQATAGRQCQPPCTHESCTEASATCTNKTCCSHNTCALEPGSEAALEGGGGMSNAEWRAMMGAGRIGSFQLESPVSIEFWLSLPRAAAQCGGTAARAEAGRTGGRHSDGASSDVGSYVVLRREYDRSFPDQCARVYVGGRVVSDWMAGNIYIYIYICL